MTETPSERQVLYALVAAAFIVIVAVLVVAAAYSGLVPMWWTAVSGIATAATAIMAGLRWRETALVLALAIFLFLSWTVGTLLVGR